MHQWSRLGAKGNSIHLDDGFAVSAYDRMAIGEIDHGLRPDRFIFRNPNIDLAATESCFTRPE
jgi:hypothetical protein